jgi:RNA polymerase sigma-70 factor (ECF subfamily)
MGPSVELTQIIDGCKSGDAASFARVVDMYSGRLYGYFYRLTGDRSLSDELLSELYMRLVEKIRTYKGGSFESWLFRIASNIFHDYLRCRKRRRKLLESKRSDVEFATPEPKVSDAKDEKLDKLQFQLARLDSDTKELIMLRFYSELSFKEIAGMRSEPIGTTLSKLHRGLKKLRELMED